jgi:asparagine synthase (glutamine-hydrolysing)
VLLHNKAIFGACPLDGNERPAFTHAREMEERARRLGLQASSQQIGHAFMGSAAMGLAPSPPHPFPISDVVQVVAAGEIANAADVNVDRPCSAKELSQSEVLLSGAYQVWGPQFLSRLDGVFAAALWDDQAKRLIVCGDLRGDAHLYYRLDGETLLFSSWLPLLADRRHEVDLHSVKEFLRFLYISPPHTIYKGISRLEPGQFLIVTDNRVLKSAVPSYLSEWEGADFFSQDPAQIRGNFEKLFMTSIRRRVADQRVGILLSGGVDSGLLTAASQRLYPGQVRAFTVGFDETELDESRSAQALARHLHVPHQLLKFDETDYRGAFKKMAEFDQPFGDPVGIPLILISEHAKQEVDVLMDGSGADGLFSAPIPRHLWFALAVSAKLPPVVRSTLGESFGKMSWSPFNRCAPLFQFDDTEELLITWKGWARKELEELFDEPCSLDDTRFYRVFQRYRPHGVQAVYDTLYCFPPDDSRFEAAGVAGVKMHLPYHDGDLVSYVKQLPRLYRMSNGHTKVILRQLFAQYFPDALVKEKKHYFTIPLQRFLAERNYEIIRDCLAPERMSRHGLIYPGRAWRWIDRYLAGDQTLRFKVWALLVLHSWMDHWK